MVEVLYRDFVLTLKTATVEERREREVVVEVFVVGRRREWSHCPIGT